MDLYISMLLLCFISLSETLGSNILVVFPHVSYSHFKATSILVKALEKNGHNVTLISPYELKVEGYTNITQISIYDIVEPLQNFRTQFFRNNNVPSSYWSKLQYTKEIGFQYASRILNNKNITNLMNSNSIFDMVLVEDVSADSLTIFSYIFKCPLVVLLSEPLSTFYENYFYDEIQWKKLNEIRKSHHYVIKELYREWFILPEQNKIIKDIFPEAPDIRKVLYNTSLVLIPSYSTLSNLIPKYLNIKQMGGFHIRDQKQISRNIENIINNSKEGIIVVSDDIRETDLNLFSNLNETVFHDIILMSDIYGEEILGHPKVKLLVGNGDIYDTAFAIHNRVPVLQVSYNCWFQQFLIDILIENEIARKIPVNKLEPKYLHEAINTLLTNNRYRENVRLASQILNFKQVHSPTDTALFWIEYIIKFDGAFHLTPRDLQLELKKHLLYIIIILVIIDIFLFLIFYWIIKHIPSLVFMPKKIWSIFHKNDSFEKFINYTQLRK